MKNSEIVAQYRATVLASYRKGSAFVLQGHCQSYDLWLASGMKQAEYATVIAKSGADAFSSVKQNLSHIDWAVNVLADETGEDASDIDVMDVMNRWENMNKLRAERYPKKVEKNVTEKKVASKKTGKFDAKREAREIKKGKTAKQIAELVRELLA